MRPFIPLLAAAGLLACGAESPSAPTAVALADVGVASAANPMVHKVTAGGADWIGPGVDANWSLVAMSFADGSVRGQWSDQFGHGHGGFHADVTCLEVDGNQAWISGVARGGEFDGRSWLTRVRDNGTSANDPPDEISYSYVAAAGTTYDCHQRAPLPLFAREKGQVKVW